MSRKKPQIESRQHWEDKAFIITRGLTGRIAGDPNAPDSVYLALMWMGSEEEPEPATTRIVGLNALKVLAAELQDVLSRLDSHGVH